MASDDLQPEEIAGLGFEPAMVELDSLTRQLESGELSLADSLAAYQRGAAILRHAQGLLEQVQRDIDLIDEQGLRSAPADDFMSPRG